jgi:hypothetical protein
MLHSIDCVRWLVAWLLGVQMALASLIVPTGVTTNMGADFGTSLTNTINGTGLLGGVPSLTASHDATLPANSWVSNTGVLTGFVDFSLGGSFLLDGFSFWNQNAPASLHSLNDQ